MRIAGAGRTQNGLGMKSPDVGSVRCRKVAGAVLLRDKEGVRLRRPSPNLQIVRFFRSFIGRPRLA